MKKKTEYAVSIDGSTSNTGVAIFETKEGEYTYVEHALFTSEKAKFTKKSKDMSKTAYKALHSMEKRKHMEQAVLYMMENIEGVLDKYKPSVVVMEDTYGKNDMMTLKMLSRIQGDVIGWCDRHGTELCFKTPSSWRKQVGMPLTSADGKPLKRDEFKALAKLIVKQVFGLDVTDDEADAICLGLSMTNALK